jgi:hypothetical protein
MLDSVEGAPEKVDKDFICYKNQILVLKKDPSKTNIVFEYDVKTVWNDISKEDIKKICDVGGRIFTSYND